MTIVIPLLIIVGFLGWALRPGIKPGAHRRNAILAVVIPVLVLAIAAVISQLVYNSGGTIEVAETANALFVVGFAFIAASILASIGFAAARKGEIARGAGFGACIAVMIGIIELGLLEWLGGV